MSLAAAAESQSEHPVATAITAYGDDGKLPVESFEAIPGQGIRAVVDGIKSIDWYP